MHRIASHRVASRPGPLGSGGAARRGAADHPERGSATAEFAVILPCIVLLLAVLLGAASCGAAAVRVEEAARVAARALARGDSPERAVQAARQIAGEEADVRIGAADAVPGQEGQAGAAGTSTVRVSVAAPGILGQWSDWRIDATATAPREPAAAGPREGAP